MKNLIVVFMLLLSCMAFAQDVVYAFFKCTVKDDNAIPIINAKVTVTAPNFTFNAITNAEGSFQTMVPEGEVTVSINDVKKNIKVTGDIVNEYQIVVPRPGLLITINDIPETLTCNIDIYCRINETQQALSVITMAKGKYWVNLPPDASQLGFILSSSTRTINQLPLMFHYYTEFKTKETSRKIELNFPQSVSPEISIKKNGVLIKDGTLINGSIAILIPDNSYLSDWVTDLKVLPLPRRQQHSSVMLTDIPVKDGKLQLPPLMPGTLYSVSLRDGNASGQSVLFNISNDGKADITEYNIVSRKVSQKVFTLRGEPAKNCNVKMSYLNGNSISLRDGKTNNEGIVFWEDMPIGRAIVWGNDIQTGVIMPDDTDIIKPLSLPKTETTVRVDFNFDFPAKIIYLQKNNPDDPGNVASSSGKTIYLQTGNNTSMLIIAQDGSGKSLLIPDLYVPYCDTPESKNRILTLAVTLIKSNTSKIKFTDKSGKNISVSKFQIFPESQQMKKLVGDNNLIEIVNGKDSSEYLINAPAGRYKILCDLYDVNNPLTIIDLPIDNIQIPVSDLICIAPAGAEIKYLTADNPLDIKKLVVSANNATVPVFGSKEKIIGWWMKVSPDTMKVMRYKSGDEESLKMQTYRIKFTNDTNVIDYLRIYPAFPDDMKNVQNWNQNLSLPNNGRIIFNDDNQILNIVSSEISLNLWSSGYFYDRPLAINSIGMFNTATMKEKDIIHEVSYKNAVSVAEKNIRIVMPVLNLAKIATRDLPPGCRIVAEGTTKKVIYASMDRNGAVVVAVPADTTSISVYTPGQGIINKFPVNGNTEISPNKYESAAKIKITVFDSAGNLIKNSPLVYRYSMPDMIYAGEFYGRIMTNDNGEGIIENAVPGDYAIIVGSDWRNFQDKRYGWVISMPDKSADISSELRPVDNPAIVQSNSDFSQLWWLGEGESKAVKIPVIYSTAVLHTAKFGSGTLLMSEYSTQMINSRKFQLKPGYNNSSAFIDTNASIILPVTPDNTIPPETILVKGEKEWDSVQVYLKPKWKVLSGIGIFATSITGLPVGKWSTELKWAGKEMKIDIISK